MEVWRRRERQTAKIVAHTRVQGRCYRWQPRCCLDTASIIAVGADVNRGKCAQAFIDGRNNVHLVALTFVADDEVELVVTIEISNLGWQTLM